SVEPSLTITHSVGRMVCFTMLSRVFRRYASSSRAGVMITYLVVDRLIELRRKSGQIVDQSSRLQVPAGLETFVGSRGFPDYTRKFGSRESGFQGYRIYFGHRIWLRLGGEYGGRGSGNDSEDREPHNLGMV